MRKIPLEEILGFIAMRAPEGKCEKSLWGVIFSDSLGRKKKLGPELWDF